MQPTVSPASPAGTTLTQQQIATLVATAIDGLARSYAPYSRFRVSAALLAADGRLFTGCNIENAAYSATICAERTAFCTAVQAGVRAFRAIAIVGGTGGRVRSYCPPCGVCRQVMREFCDPRSFTVILADSLTHWVTYRLEELLPYSFGPACLAESGPPDEGPTNGSPPDGRDRKDRSNQTESDR